MNGAVTDARVLRGNEDCGGAEPEGGATPEQAAAAALTSPDERDGQSPDSHQMGAGGKLAHPMQVTAPAADATSDEALREAEAELERELMMMAEEGGDDHDEL